MKIDFCTNDRGLVPEAGRTLMITAINEMISFLDLFKIINILLDNEEKIFPRHMGRQGNEFLKAAIIHVLQGEEPQKVYDEFMFNKDVKNVGKVFFNPKEWRKIYCHQCHEDIICPKCNQYVYIQKGDVE